MKDYTFSELTRLGYHVQYLAKNENLQNWEQSKVLNQFIKINKN